MTVKELIEKLQNFDDDLNIEVNAEYDCGYWQTGGTVDSVEFIQENCVLFV